MQGRTIPGCSSTYGPDRLIVDTGVFFESGPEGPVEGERLRLTLIHGTGWHQIMLDAAGAFELETALAQWGAGRL